MVREPAEVFIIHERVRLSLKHVISWEEKKTGNSEDIVKYPMSNE